MMNCSVRSTFGFEESALNARTVIKIIPITPIAKKMHEGKLSNPASIAEPFKFVLSTMSVVIRTINPIGIKIRIYLLNPLKTLYFQGISPILCSNLMYFPLFLPLRAETRESFLLSADHLIQQSCGSTLRFPCSVSVNIHCGTDIGMSEKLLHILRRCPV